MININNQKPFKPKIADIISDLLDGEDLEIALEFISYLTDNKINVQWTNANTWKAVKKGVTVCYIKAGIENKSDNPFYVKLINENDFGKGSWVINPHIPGLDGYPHVTDIKIPAGYEEIFNNKKIFNIICSKVRPCSNCGNLKKCAPGINVNFWGKKLDNRCKFFGIPFLDPDSEELECVKLLINTFRKFKNI